MKRFKYVHIVVIYVAFFTLIGITVYITKSAIPLWALLLTPTYKSED